MLGLIDDVHKMQLALFYIVLECDLTPIYLRINSEIIGGLKKFTTTKHQQQS